MIQRIQTVFLILSLGLMSTLFYFPVAKIIGADEHIYYFYFDGLKPAVQLSRYYMQTMPLAILLFGICLVNFMNIFLYKRRVLQMRLCMFNIILMIGSIGLMYFYLMHMNSILKGNIHYDYPFIFPLISAILTYLAFRGIRRDELLVRSLDRIR